MLFHSSVRKEMARSFGATVVVLATIVMTMLLIRTLNLAQRGSVNPTEVVVVLGYTVLGHAPTILTLSLFIAIVGTLSRMYRDSEMVIWFSSGRGLASFVWPLVRFVWPVLVMIAALALFGWPWAHQQSQKLKDRFESRSDMERVAPGQFQESAGGHRVFFIDKDSVSGKSAGEVFIAANERGVQTVTSARAGRVETINGDQFLLLANGQQLESANDQSSIKISDFDEYGVLINEKAREIERATPPRVLSTQALLAGRTPAYLGELSWRIGLAMVAVNFVLIGLAAAGVNPRVGRSVNIAFAFLAFIVYFNFLVLGKSWIESTQVRFDVFLLALHGGALTLALLWLAKRHNHWRIKSLRPSPLPGPEQKVVH